jgi:hypothetical protein
MRDINNAKTAIRILTNNTHPTRHYFNTKNTHDEYASKTNTQKPVFIRATEHFGNLDIDVRKIEKHLQTTPIDEDTKQSNRPTTYDNTKWIKHRKIPDGKL